MLDKAICVVAIILTIVVSVLVSVAHVYSAESEQPQCYCVLSDISIYQATGKQKIIVGGIYHQKAFVDIYAKAGVIPAGSPLSLYPIGNISGCINIEENSSVDLTYICFETKCGYVIPEERGRISLRDCNRCSAAIIAEERAKDAKEEAEREAWVEETLKASQKREKERAAEEKQRIAEEKKRAAQEKRERQEKRIAAIERTGWPEAFKQAVLKRQVVIGMTKEMVLTSWGSPTAKNITVTARGQSEQWVYYHSRYVYFDNSIVTAIQSQE